MTIRWPFALRSTYEAEVRRLNYLRYLDEAEFGRLQTREQIDAEDREYANHGWIDGDAPWLHLDDAPA